MLQIESNTLTETFTEATVPTSEKIFATPSAYKLLPADQIAAEVAAFTEEMPDVVCFSGLRWDFVRQRPQHLLSRFAQHSRLFFVEEPVLVAAREASLLVTEPESGVTRVQPQLPKKLSEKAKIAAQKSLLEQFFIDKGISNYLFWYYTPAAIEFSDHLMPSLTIYDCLNTIPEDAPPRLKALEERLIEKADLVFTGGQALYEAKNHLHQHMFAFPGSVDVAHFAQARTIIEEPVDQSNIPLIRIGFYGIIDERVNLELLRAVAELKPELHIVMLGPVVNIDPETLPQLPNLHYLGAKSYNELPAYLSGWDVALIPFAINDTTKFASISKTPEYLAAGRPVVSTPLPDVVKPYGDMNLVQIAATPAKFAAAIDKALEQNQDMVWQQKTDRFLREQSWDLTWKNMVYLMQLAATDQLPENRA